MATMPLFLTLILLTLAASVETLQVPSLPKVKAAVIVPGFLTGENDFRQLATSLSERGIPSVVVPMPVWHWLPCIGGRGMRPILERIDHTVRHVCASLDQDGDATGDIAVPRIQYSLIDCIADFMDNPGGISEVGGSAEVDDYPVVEPRGTFLAPEQDPRVRIALIGHSAGGWISRVYLSHRNYGGKAYSGSQFVHSLVTLGTPHADAPGPAFRGVEWCNRENLPIRGLAVGAVGSPGNASGDLTKGAYAFCDPTSDGSDMDGDGLTPTFSSLAMEGDEVETLVLENVTHFPWSDAGVWGDLLAPDLAKEHKAGKLWYGDNEVIDQWAKFLEKT